MIPRRVRKHRVFFHLTNPPSIQITISVGLLLLFVSLLVAWIYSSYFGRSYVRLLVFPGNDGNCNHATEALGVHCWGDYSVLRFNSIFDLPTEPESLYPLGARLLRIPLWLIEMFFGPRAEILVFQLISTISCLSPLIIGTKNRPVIERCAILVVYGFCSVGFVTLIDRGNIIGLTVLPLYIYCRELRKGNPSTPKLATSLLIIGLIKPQFLILGMLLTATKVKSKMIPTVGLVVLIVLVTQVVLGSGLQSIQDWYVAATDWSRSLRPDIPYPTNLSANKLLYLIFRKSFGIGFWLPILIVLILIAVRALQKIQLKTLDLVSVLMSMIIFGSISYVYYLVLIIPAVSLLIEDEYRFEMEDQVVPSLKVPRALFLVLTLCSAPLALPQELFGGVNLNSENVWPIFVTAMIFCSVICYVTAQLKSMVSQGTFSI